MKSFLSTALSSLEDSGLARVGISSPLTIPSGIITTAPSVIARVAEDVPEIGFLTTKTLSVEPRQGYREPVLHEYHPGCFVNAVGLANPGAHAFRHEMEPLLPLAGNKPLVVSIMGSGPEEFAECARILEPIAHAFELNFSCPHVKGAGQSVGSDPDAVRETIRLLKKATLKPIIPKLSPNLGNIPRMAELCRDAGADALTLINTVGPGIATDEEGNPILSNEAGGLSGAAILPLGVKAVQEASSGVDLPIIAAGGIGCAEDVKAYRRAGACLFSIGSALAGMTAAEIADFFRRLVRTLQEGSGRGRSAVCRSEIARTTYVKTRVSSNVPVGPNLFELTLEQGPACEPGRFFFLRLPRAGEKPFSPASDDPPTFLVRKVGPFTSALQALNQGDALFLRGPYGKGFPEPRPGSGLVLVGGGTGAAPLMMASDRRRDFVRHAFFGFSEPISEGLADEILTRVPSSRILIDPPSRPGEVVGALAEDIESNGDDYEDCTAYVCGPAPMMRAAVRVLLRRVRPDALFIAREDVMRCGIGVCGSCGTRSGLRSCVDGPVMRPEIDEM
jgi:dihydroorotate dehydrogenase (NAD+) catalytic subunit